MRIRDIITLYDYNYWANSRILVASANINEEQFVAPAEWSHAGLRGTLLHTFDGEYSWRMLCQHNTMTFNLDEAQFPTFDVLVQRWHAEEAAMRAYLGNLTDDALDGAVRYTTDEGVRRERVLWHCLVHVVPHGTQHRSEAAARLTEFGASPGDLDFTLFLTERRV